MDQSKGCDCNGYLLTIILLINAVCISLKCAIGCRSYFREELEMNDRTFKKVILDNMDKTLMKFMKNGNEDENEHED